MKYWTRVGAMLVASISSILTAGAVRAQIYPVGTTTIYAPSNETTTTVEIAPNVYRTIRGTTTTTTTTSYGSYPTTTTNIYRYNSYDPRIDNYYYRQSGRQPTVIFQQNNIYPNYPQSTCSTAIIGSPIPSPVPLDRSGRPCR